MSPKAMSFRWRWSFEQDSWITPSVRWVTVLCPTPQKQVYKSTAFLVLSCPCLRLWLFGVSIYYNVNIQMGLGVVFLEIQTDIWMDKHHIGDQCFSDNYRFGLDGLFLDNEYSKGQLLEELRLSMSMSDWCCRLRLCSCNAVILTWWCHH